MVISRPSRTQATPRARTIRVWNGAHESRSILAGLVLRMPAVLSEPDVGMAIGAPSPRCEDGGAPRLTQRQRLLLPRNRVRQSREWKGRIGRRPECLACRS